MNGLFDSKVRMVGENTHIIACIQTDNDFLFYVDVLTWYTAVLLLLLSASPNREICQ